MRATPLGGALSLYPPTSGDTGTKRLDRPPPDGLPEGPVEPPTRCQIEAPGAIRTQPRPPSAAARDAEHQTPVGGQDDPHQLGGGGDPAAADAGTPGTAGRR